MLRPPVWGQHCWQLLQQEAGACARRARDTCICGEGEGEGEGKWQPSLEKPIRVQLAKGGGCPYCPLHSGSA